jgi:transposase
MPRSPGHPFYVALNKLLVEAKFDAYVEGLCEPLYREGGRPGVPPGVFFRMLFVGYFEGIDSQRGIAWRCSDSMSLRSFLGLLPTEASPDHSSLTVIRKRLPKELIEQVFSFVLKIAFEKKLVKGQTVGVDSTTLEANAAMKSIVRREGGDTWKQYLTKLAKEAGIEDPTDAELRRFDRKRKGKKTSNDDWKSPTDPDSRIVKMKDGTTHLAYKAEHVVDLDSNIVIGATIQPGNAADGETVKETIVEAQGNLNDATEQQCCIAEIAADKGYNKTETLVWAEERGIRTYIPEAEHKHGRRWDDKPDGWQTACYNTRRRVARDKGKALQRTRSELVERTFAHVCKSGGARKTWLRDSRKSKKGT